MKGRLRRWKLVLPLVALVAVGATIAGTSLAASEGTRAVRVAIMTDCKGAFAFGYEFDIGGAQAAFAQFAGGKSRNKTSLRRHDRDHRSAQRRSRSSGTAAVTIRRQWRQGRPAG